MPKIIFNIATVERRKNFFISVLKALSNQKLKCDKINVAASYMDVDSDIIKILSGEFASYDIKWGHFTAIEKMYALENSPADSIFFTVDDDIDYALDYSQKMVDGVERYERKAVVGFHGKYFRRFPVTNYYDNNRRVYQYFSQCMSDANVHVIGTGVCAFYTGRLFEHGLTDNAVFKEGLKKGYGNYNDMIFSKYLREKNIPMIVLKHPRHWLRPIPGSQTTDALWVQKKAKGRDIELSFLQS